MRKFKIILINIFIVIIFLITGEVICYYKDTNEFEKRPSYTLNKKEYEVKELKKNMRKPSGLEYKKRPILIYGCSYAYGFGLKEEETFGYQLSKYTKRPVYNFGLSSKGLQDALYLLKNDEKVTPEPEYIFYIFINDHVRRMFVNCNKIDNTKYLRYFVKDGQLREEIISDNFYLLRNLKNSLYYLLKDMNREKIFNLVKIYLINIRDEAKLKYPSAKFIVIDYGNSQYNYFSESRLQELEREGIKIISLNKIFKGKLRMNKYRNSEKDDVFRHPNGNAWEITVKYLKKRYKL